MKNGQKGGRVQSLNKSSRDNGRICAACRTNLQRPPAESLTGDTLLEEQLPQLPLLAELLSGADMKRRPHVRGAVGASKVVAVLRGRNAKRVIDDGRWRVQRAAAAAAAAWR
jgi:hypothetical protein